METREKKCGNCEETLPLESFKGKNHKSCINCSGTPTSPAMSAKNFKLKVPIQEHNGHKFIPVKGRCPLCEPVTDKEISRKCGWCPKIVKSATRRFCTDICSQAYVLSKRRKDPCFHCDEPMKPDQAKFCSLKCTEDYKKNINRISKL